MMRESHDIDLDAEEDYEICDATERQGRVPPKVCCVTDLVFWMTPQPESAAGCQSEGRPGFRESPHHRDPSSGYSGRQFPLYLSLSDGVLANTTRPPMPVEYGIQAVLASLISLIGAKKVESRKTDLSWNLGEGLTPRVQCQPG